jgi:UDP-glucose 4-epimerase
MKVLITGGAGFIGSHLADRLTARGDQALVIDNYSTGRRDNLSPKPGLTVVEGSITDPDLVRRLFEDFRPDQVAHAAASYKDPEDWTGDVTTNALGTAIVVQAAKAVNVQRLIYFQTALCYGLHPLEQPITLDHPLRPEGSSYAISKTAGEQYIQLSGLDYVSFRLANMYGPRNLSGPLPTFYHRLSTGRPCYVVDTRRDFIFIADAIDLLEMALDGKGEEGIYHMSSGSDYSIEELFEATVAAMDITLDEPVEVRPRSADDVASILIDPSRTIHDFGWEPTTPLDRGVLPAIDWYREHGISQTYTHLRQADSPSAS